MRTGEVLWQLKPELERPIASLTKMMTALLVARTDPRDARVKISRNAAHTQGSATGLLPLGQKVPLEALLKALILISANDAAVALAEHDGGSVPHFIKEMNEQARSMGLTCTHFTTPNGLRDRGNHSCPHDLATLARADLANKRIAQIARTRYAKPSFPIKGKHLYLTNNHYFLQHGTRRRPRRRGDWLEDGLHRRRGQLLRHHGPPRPPSPRARAAALAQPPHPGARPAPGGFRGGRRDRARSAGASGGSAADRVVSTRCGRAFPAMPL